jgi:DNA-binding protein Fis
MMSEAGIERVTRRCVADLIGWDVPYEQALTEFRREYMRQLLVLTKGNQTEAAKLIGVHRNSIRRYLDGLGICGRRPYRREARHNP